MIKCLFLVEGPYDLQRLSLLKGLFDENKLEIIPLEGDKLTNKDYISNYRSIISGYLNKISTHSLDDFDLLAQICDTDGCFIDKTFIHPNSLIRKIKYYRNHVETIDVNSKITRDEHKRNNINSLLNNGEIELYYNSCNIDDAFDGVINPSKKQKGSLAIEMYNKYKDNLSDFIDLIFASDKTGSISYQNSWDIIKSGFNSLSQTSNLKYFLINHINELKEEYKKYVLSLINENLI